MLLILLAACIAAWFRYQRGLKMVLRAHETKDEIGEEEFEALLQVAERNKSRGKLTFQITLVATIIATILWLMLIVSI